MERSTSGRLLALVAATLALSTLGARAADMPMKSAPTMPSPGYNWTGAYLGVSGGFWAGEMIGPGTAGNNVGGSASYFAVNGGYRYQIPAGLVLGFDISAPVWVSTSSFSTPTAAPTVSQSKPQFILIPEVQVGYALGQFLPYLGIGVGIADVKGSFRTPAGAMFSDTQLSPLVAVSFGVDYALNNNWIIGIRYDHIDLEQHNYTFSTPFAPTVLQVGAVGDGVSGALRYKF